MNEHQPNWTACLDNQHALNKIFNGTAPVLDMLSLAQLVLGRAGDAYISLDFPSLPPASPRRWIDRGCDCVQLRLSFRNLTQLSIAGAYGHVENLEVAAAFGPGRHFTLWGSELEVRFVYEHGKAELYPFDSRIFEEPRGWYRR